MPEKKADAKPPASPPSFEDGLQQLEAIVKEMESGELPWSAPWRFLNAACCSARPAANNLPTPKLASSSSPAAPARCNPNPSVRAKT